MSLLKRIHVNRQRIAQNKKTKKQQPVITVKTSKSNIYAKKVQICGPSRIVYSPKKPLNCGAVLWIETRSKVIVGNKIIE